MELVGLDGKKPAQVIDERFSGLAREGRDRLARTLDFAARAHGRQRRKNSLDEPYIVHPLGVAHLLYRSGVSQIDVLQAALLHDTIEDTDVVEEDILYLFGFKVLDIVLQCTDDKDLPKEERKRLQISTAATKTWRARAVKLADKLYNLRDIIRSPPVNWTSERIQEYFVWAEKVTRNCTETVPPGCQGLVTQLDRLYRDGTFAWQGHRLKCHPTIEASGKGMITRMSTEDLVQLSASTDIEGYLEEDKVDETEHVSSVGSDSEDAESSSSLDTEMHEILAQEHWDESLAQFKLILSVIVGPLVGKWLGRRVAIWGWEVVIRRGWGGFIVN